MSETIGYDVLKLRDKLESTSPDDIDSAEKGNKYIRDLASYRQAAWELSKNLGKGFHKIMRESLTVGKEGIYSDRMRLFFELVQNADDCEYDEDAGRELDIFFDSSNNRLVLEYDEIGFKPKDVFAITGIGESFKDEEKSIKIGEKGIGFKSVFGLAEKVRIESGWFSFEIETDDFIVPKALETSEKFEGTRLTLFLKEDPESLNTSGVQNLYDAILARYAPKNESNYDVVFCSNPVLFLNNLTSIRFRGNDKNYIEFRKVYRPEEKMERRDSVCFDPDCEISLNIMRDGQERPEEYKLSCYRFVLPATFSEDECRARYGNDTAITERRMYVSAMVPKPDQLYGINKGMLYSFMPTKMALSVPVICDVPFKLQPSREYVDVQEHNSWFKKARDTWAELMHSMYRILSREETVGEAVVRYIPRNGENIIDDSNIAGDSRWKCLNGDEFNSRELFRAANGSYNYNRASWLFFFAQAGFEENSRKRDVSEPETVRRYLDISKYLFDLPYKAYGVAEDMDESEKTAKIKDMEKDLKAHGIEAEEDAYNRLFKEVLSNPRIDTRSILDYLDSAEYTYPFEENEININIGYNPEKLCTLLEHNIIFDKLYARSINALRNGRESPIHIDLILNRTRHGAVTKYISSGNGFDMDRLSEKVKKYLGENFQRVCILLNLPKDRFLACKHCLILPNENTEIAFMNFCLNLDPNDNSAAHLIHRRQSLELIKAIEDTGNISADEFMDILIEDCRSNFDQFKNKKDYDSSISAVLNVSGSGTAFISELLQNADDAEYPEGETPHFKMSLTGNNLLTAEYNETGFSREDIAAVTKLFQSTKSKVRKDGTNPVGEKGVGFKSVYRAADRVTIHSGEYHFAMEADRPTIPIRVKVGGCDDVTGTKMEMELKNSSVFNALDGLRCNRNDTVLELCLCLRNLKELDIFGHNVTISDKTDKAGKAKRIIIIKTDGNETKYTFRRIDLSFAVSVGSNAAHAHNIESSGKDLNGDEKITCFYLESQRKKENGDEWKNVESKERKRDFPVYCGLPTSHRANIPIAIDARFSLNTSRSQIRDDSEWNKAVKGEVYNAILKVIDEIKGDYFSFSSKYYKVFSILNRRSAYGGCLFDYLFLNDTAFTAALRGKKTIPVLGGEFYSPESKKALWTDPELKKLILRKPEWKSCEPASRIIDLNYEDDAYDTGNFLKAFGMSIEDHYLDSIELLCNIFEKDNDVLRGEGEDKDKFRELFYNGLRNISRNCISPEDRKECREKLKKLSIVPVYTKDGKGTEYICFNEIKKIRTQEGVTRSFENYYVLDEKVISSGDFLTIFGEESPEYDPKEESNEYNQKLLEYLQKDFDDWEERFDCIMTRYKNGEFDKNDSYDTLRRCLERVVLKTQDGGYSLMEWKREPSLFLYEKEKPLVSKWLKDLTVSDECRELAIKLEIEKLSAAAFNSFKDRKLYKNEENMLAAVDAEEFIDVIGNYEDILREFYHGGRLSYELMQECDIGYLAIDDIDVTAGGYSADWLDISDEAEDCDKESPVQDKYISSDEAYLCYCQMCRKKKPKPIIQSVPLCGQKPEITLAMCPDCRSRFEIVMKNSEKRQKFIDSILAFDPDGSDPKIRLSGKLSVTFSEKHLTDTKESLSEKKTPEN